MELVAARGYFFCRYCGSFDFPEGASDQGIKVLGQEEATGACPICEKPLSQALLDGEHPVRFCKNCRGVLLPRRSFAAVVEKRRAWATDPPGPAVPLNRSELDRAIRCPVCKARMVTHPYYGPGNVVMDSCAACDLAWLDFGELKQIVDAPGKDRGRRDDVPRSTGDPSIGGITGARMIGGSLETQRGPDLLDLVFRLF